MVGPLAIILAIPACLNYIIMGVSWIKNLIDNGSSSPATSLTTIQTDRPAILPPPVTEDTAKIEYENFKQRKKSLQSFESNDHRSSSNSGSAIGLILIISVVLAFIAFIVYRKRNRFKENRFTFHQTEKQFDTPPSPPTTQTEQNLTIV